MIAILALLALQVTPELRQHVDAGLKAKAAGDLSTAAREFSRVVELAPALPAAHVNLGAVYFEKREYGRAIPVLKKALELNSDLPGAHAMLGAALLAQGFAKESIAHLEKAGSDDLLGVALLEDGRTREAVDRLEAALLKRPEDPDLLYYLGQAHGLLSREAFERLRAGGSDSPRVQQALGEARAAAGNREAAEKHFRAALAGRPDLRGVHYAIGELHLETGEYQKAEAEFRAESEIAPGSAAAAYKLGLTLLNLGRVKEAVEALRRSNEMEAEMPETLLALGRALNAAGEAAEAEKHLQGVVRLEPASALGEAAHFQLAQAYRRLGRTADAERETKLFQELKSRRK